MESTVKRSRFISAMLLTTLLVATIMAAFSAFGVANEVRVLLAPASLYIDGETIPNTVTVALTIRDVLVLAFSIACLIIYLRFCLDIVSTHSIFTRKQCRRLLIVGLLLLVSSVVSAALDGLCTVQLPDDVSMSAIGIFGFNAWTLVLALFALSLSAIFEYGRLLQSDVDAII